MRRLSYLGIVTCVVALLGGGLAWRYGAVILNYGAVPSSQPNPEDGTVTNAAYRNAYFDLSYPLPEGWTEGLPGPEPSHSAYYVLGTLVPNGELTATILIAAQDMFFADDPQGGLAGVASDFREAMSRLDGMTIDREPAEMKVADRLVQRVDFSGVGLYRTMVALEIRCHVVSFLLTAQDPEQLAKLAASLDKLSVAGDKPGPAVPPCIKDYVVADNLVHRVEPPAVVPKYVPIPVRLFIGVDGGVKHVHVIRAPAEHRKIIEDALRQWRFKPYMRDGRPIEIETGVVLQSSLASR